MWSIELSVPDDDRGAPYDRRAALYDRLVRSTVYNRVLWGASPREYEAFAAAAVSASDGRLLDAAAGSAAATAPLYRSTRREVVLVDRSVAMLDRAAQRIAGAGGELPPHVRLVQADLLALPETLGRFDTVLCQGALHLFVDITPLLATLRARLTSGGELHVSSLVDAHPRGRHYLRLLHRAGEVAAVRTPAELTALLGASVEVRGSMAYAVLSEP